MLYCPNYSCQTPNPETHKFCQKCRTLLPRHYLWMVGEKVDVYHPGDLLGDRYLCKSARIFLDTKPGLTPETVAEVPQAFVRYLRLSPYQLHVPQVYAVLPAGTSGVSREVLLLDQAALYIPPNSADAQLLPTLGELWHSASALRQLNWLWQMAQLWQPLSSEQTASSLLVPESLRVEGALMRLLELYPDPGAARSAPSLAQLGQLWGSWVPSAHPAIAVFLEHLCQQLVQGTLRNAEQLMAAIDQGLAELGQRQTRQIHLATGTDQGPTRQRNEDACYPASGTVKTLTISPNQTAADPAVVIVCDGIGGHQGGNVASNLAIAAIQERLQSLHPEQLDAATLTAELEQAVWIANDQISERNDSEQRFDRQRMGTTLVMGLVRGHELYATHVGDSRVYWITRWSCRQVTLDDDIASREVRLGYSSYPEALQQPGAGSLVQALGMGSSNLLHPTVQRFMLDEDCVFLLCSDGLSDNDRVEEYWETEILPLIDGKVDVATACQRLVAIANTRNGHDNVTVGLMHCQVAQPPQGMEQRDSEPLAVPLVQPVAGSQAKTIPVVPKDTLPPSQPLPTQATGSTASTLKTQLVQPARAKSNLLPLVLSILVLLGLGGLLAYFLFPSVSGRIDPYIGLNPSSDPEPTATPSPSVSLPSAPVATSSTPLPLQLNAFLAIAPRPTGAPPLVLLPQLATNQSPAPASPTARTVIPEGSILQVLRRQSIGQTRWVQVRVCSLPSGAIAAPAASTTPPPTPAATTPSPAASAASPNAAASASRLAPGTIGWVEEAAVSSQVRSSTQLSSAQRGNCSVAPTATPSPAVSPTQSASPSAAAPASSPPSTLPSAPP